MATQLGLYNAALIELGQPELSGLTENVEARRILDALYSNVVADCLEAGSWNFATKTIQADHDPLITPAFGYQYVFAKPSDWIRTIAVSADEHFAAPLTAFVDDVNYWSADVSPIYIRFISNSASWGLNLTAWPRSFTRYVELELSLRACERIGQTSSKREVLKDERDKARRSALNKDAMNEAQPKFAPPGRLTMSRSGGWHGRDRGNRGSLIG